MAGAETAVHETVPPAQSASRVGQIVDGRYRLVRKLGEGRTGEVYAAQHVVIGKQLAIKLLHQELGSSPEAATRLFEAARAMFSIVHRNIAAVLDCGDLADGRIYLCMELLEGAALGELTAQSIGVDRLLDIVMQAGEGLAAAHARGIVHRDLTPENIFVTVGPRGEDVPKLLDVGLAVSGSEGQNSVTRTGMIFGTPSYMAPEQAAGKPVDARTDIYALGAIMYEGFSGTPPFQGDSVIDIVTQHLTTEPEPVAQRAARAGRQLPPGLAETITRCLQKDPAQRFQTMDELVRALSQTRGGLAPGGPLSTTESGGLPGSAGVVLAAPGDGRALAGGLAPGCADPSSAPAPAAADSPAAPPLALDENVQFTVYRPRAIAPARWYSLLAFAHLAERRSGEIDAPDPIDEVRRQAEGVLAEQAAAYQSTTQDSGAAIPADGELVFVVEIPGVEVNPPRRSFLWTEPVHREEFRIRAAAQLVGATARGRLTVFLGCIVIAELPLALRVDAAPATAAVEHTQVRTYRRIFASYSHRDRAIVHQFERYARALGDEYLRDAVDLRSGEIWNDRLLQMIEQADAFQLFWSHHSMHSPYVRREYEHALSLDRPSFVRPTYWEDPMPRAEGLPPEALRRLHFQKLGGIPGDPQPASTGDPAERSMPRPEKSDDSLPFSLRELQQIADSRTQDDEEQAVRSAEQARIAAVQDAERRRLEAEAAKERAEREERIPIEQAREHAERAARPRAESAEAVERQHLQAALEQQRLQHEMELRRAETQRRAGPATPRPGDVLSPPREHSGAHRIDAPDAGPNKPVRLEPSEGVVSVARTQKAAPPRRVGRLDLRRLSSRREVWLALVALLLLAACVLLRWII